MGRISSWRLPQERHPSGHEPLLASPVGSPGDGIGL